MGAVVMIGDSWSDRVRALVEETCREQGVPLHVTDGRVLGQVAVLLGADVAGRRALARSASTAPDAAGSEAPHRTDALDRN
jgi:hypothetical protein